MKREEAIIRFEKQLKAAQVVLDSGFGSNPGESDRLYRERKEMAEIALAALRGPTREQVEKMRGTWIPVMESEITGFDPEFAGRDPIGGYKCSRCKVEAVFDCNDEYVLSDFCHECGAPMTEEAVDIVMKRLEGDNNEG